MAYKLFSRNQPVPDHVALAAMGRKIPGAPQIDPNHQQQQQQKPASLSLFYYYLLKLWFIGPVIDIIAKINYGLDHLHWAMFQGISFRKGNCGWCMNQ